MSAKARAKNHGRARAAEATAAAEASDDAVASPAVAAVEPSASETAEVEAEGRVDEAAAAFSVVRSSAVWAAADSESAFEAGEQIVVQELRSSVATSRASAAGAAALRFSSHLLGAARFEVSVPCEAAPLRTSKGSTAAAVREELARNFYTNAPPSQEGKNEPDTMRQGSRSLAAAGEPAHSQGPESTPSGIARFLDFPFTKARTSQFVQEKMMLQKKPFFTVLWNLLVLLAWVIDGVHSGGDLLNVRAGLDSAAPFHTDLRVHGEHCEDYRREFWRWWLYQFTHVGISHVAFNVLLLLFLGIPLEGFHGSLRVLLIFNLGVVCAALVCMVASPHLVVVGMSGGCYTFFGMHYGDLFMNWRQRQYRWQTLCFLVVLGIFDLLMATVFSDKSDDVAVFAHLGGYILGVCAVIWLGRSLVSYRYQRLLKVLSTAVLLLVIIFSLVWSQLWPPRSLFDLVPWCWYRQVYSPTVFSDYTWHCVRCHSKACIDKWSAYQTQGIALSDCRSLGGWSFTEPA